MLIWMLMQMKAVIDESVLTISGGFGTFRLGQEDSMSTKHLVSLKLI